MADLTTEELKGIVDSLGGPEVVAASKSETARMVVELQRHRATMQLALEYGDLPVAHMETLLSYVTYGVSPARELLPEIRSLVAEILRHRAARSRSNRMKGG